MMAGSHYIFGRAKSDIILLLNCENVWTKKNILMGVDDIKKIS